MHFPDKYRQVFLHVLSSLFHEILLILSPGAPDCNILRPPLPEGWVGGQPDICLHCAGWSMVDACLAWKLDSTQTAKLFPCQGVAIAKGHSAHVSDGRQKNNTSSRRGEGRARAISWKWILSLNHMVVFYCFILVLVSAADITTHPLDLYHFNAVRWIISS